MDAIILAGGLGTRLRPWTSTVAKPLIPLANRPMLDHLLARLAPPVDHVILAVGYRSDLLHGYVRSRPKGLDIELVEEPTLLGTGGAVKNVQDRLRGSGPLVVCNGDILCSLDVAAMVRSHRSSGAVGTLALWEVPDPSAFGVVALDGDRIVRFVEKPPPGQAPSALISAGVYVLQPEVLDLLRPGAVASLEREVFPALAQRGLRGFTFSGYWADAGTPPSLLAAQAMVLDDPVHPLPPDLAVPQGHWSAHWPVSEISAPVAVHPTAILEDRTAIGPNVAIGPRARLHAGAVVRTSVLAAEVRIGAGAVVEGSLLAQGAKVGAGAVVSGCVVGELSTVPQGAQWRGRTHWEGLSVSPDAATLPDGQG